jgi:hypothetical protein
MKQLARGLCLAVLVGIVLGVRRRLESGRQVGQSKAQRVLLRQGPFIRQTHPNQRPTEAVLPAYGLGLRS